MDNLSHAELSAILCMCDHEQLMFKVCASMVAGLQTRQSEALVAGIAAKAAAAIEVLAKASVEAK